MDSNGSQPIMNYGIGTAVTNLETIMHSLMLNCVPLNRALFSALSERSRNRAIILVPLYVSILHPLCSSSDSS